jgi:hypothetical protein
VLNVLILRVQFSNVDWCLKVNTSNNPLVLQIPEKALPVGASTEKVSATARPAQGLNLTNMALELARNAHSLDIEDDNSSIGASRGQQVTLTIESNTDRMAAAKGASCLLGVILEEHERIDECEIRHCVGSFKEWEFQSSLSVKFTLKFLSVYFTTFVFTRASQG